MERKTAEQRDQELLTFISEMADPSVDTTKEPQKWISRLEGIYLIDENTEDVHRHSYASLSDHMYRNEWTPETVTLCLENLQALTSSVEENKIRKALRKLRDHIELEGVHISQLQSVKMAAKDMPELINKHGLVLGEVRQIIAQIKQITADMENKRATLEDFENRLVKSQSDQQELQKQAQRIQGEIQDHNAQTVSILGIFAGVVFAFSGGFSMLGSVFSNFYQITKEQSFFFLAIVLAVGIILYDVIYVLLRIVGKYKDSDHSHIKAMTYIINGVSIVLVVLCMGIYHWPMAEKVENNEVELINTPTHFIQEVPVTPEPSEKVTDSVVGNVNTH